MIKKILMVAALLFPMLAAAQTLKIGVVSTNEIISAMPETTAAQAKLQETQKQYEERYNKLGEQIQKLYEEVKNMKADELPAIRDQKTRELQDQQQKLQLFEQQVTQDMQQQQETLLSPIIKKVQDAVQSVGREGGFSLIQDYNPQLTLYRADPVVDITPLVKAKLGLK